MSGPSRQSAEFEAAALEFAVSAPKRRALVVINPYATTVSDRLRSLVVHALSARYEVEAIDTQARGHATEICREGAWEGYDLVVAFGGDGTVNEVINGLAGSPTPLTCLPGGRTNVYCKLLGIPGEIVDATEHVLAMADTWRPRVVDLGIVNGRYFAFSSGLGLDASVVRRVDGRPRLKARLGANYFVYAALTTFAGRYLVRPPRLIAHVDGTEVHGVSAIVQNAEHYTYFNDRPVDVSEGAGLDSGELAGIVLQRASLRDAPSILVRMLSRRLALINHRRIHGLDRFTDLDVHTADDRPLPLHVDGDYIGDVLHAHYDVSPRRLTVVS
ncbi:MAG TPA: diacylglycerol kinase family protein [Solirubrobacteraceae bacterium]|nr:diacylglycerol kinase family protein [Solirubrobacteraceae bacterium]